MASWFFPIGNSFFRLSDALSEGKGIVDIRSSYSFAVGDILYVYRPKPENQLKYEFEIMETDIPADASNDRADLWSDLDAYYNGILTSKYCRLKLLRRIDDKELTGEALCAHGLRNTISVDRLSDDTVAFIQSPTNDDTYGVDYPDDVDFYEGALMKVKVNKYERSRSARDKCLAAHGYSCSICGMNFEERYGPMGKGFIHVHHLVPISSIGKEYKLNAEQDLVPVCPNCHYMLHRKAGGVYSPKELKEILKSLKSK